jgi:phage shock protein A
MALINRISKLFTADFHAVLDRIEEPEVLLKQAIREMEEELEDADSRLRHSSLDLTQLQAREKDLEDQHSGFDGQLDLCFESGEDALARGLIKRKLETERMLKTIRARRELLQADLAEQQASVEENRARLDSMRQKAAVLIEESAVGCGVSYAEASSPGNDFNVLDDEIEVAFLREKQQRSTS